MKKFIFLAYMIFSALTFGKQVEIEFHFDVDSGLIYYSNADIDSIGNLTTVNFNKKDVKINLKNGIYLFGFFDGKDKYLFKKFYITDNRDFKISFIPKKSIFVEGIISEKKSPLKNVKITFADSMGREYSAVSSADGRYSISLPPEKYTLMSSQFGYETVKNENFDFSEPDKSYTIPVSMEKSPGKIKGKVLGDNGLPIPDAKILVSNNKVDQIFQSDKSGNFTIFLTEGITSMKISKEGYNSKGFISSFSRNDTVSLHVFTLDKKTYFISGTAADEILPLRDQEVYLFSQNGALLDKAVTNENGNFKFLNISRDNIYIYIPETETHEEYKSDILKLEKSISNKIISIPKK